MKLISLVIMFLGTVLVSPAYSKIPHPIFNRLLRLQPTLDKSSAMGISNAIYKCYKRIGVDKYLITAIYNQESSMDYKAKNCLKGILTKGSLSEIIRVVKKNARRIIDPDKLISDLTHIPLKVCFDLGIGQINVATALKYEKCKDLARLAMDYNYNISCSCKILEDFKKRYARTEKTWWTRYNANHPKKREMYRQLVMRYYTDKKEVAGNGHVTQIKKKVSEGL